MEDNHADLWDKCPTDAKQDKKVPSYKESNVPTALSLLVQSAEAALAMRPEELLGARKRLWANR